MNAGTVCPRPIHFMKVSVTIFTMALGIDGLFCGWILASFAGHAPLLQEFVSSQGSWWLWRSETMWRYRPVLCGIAFLLAAGVWFLGWWAHRRCTALWLKIFLPVALGPLLISVLLYRDCLSPLWSVNLIFYFSLLLLSLSLTAWLSGPFACTGPARLRLNPTWTIGIGASPAPPKDTYKVLPLQNKAEQNGFDTFMGLCKDAPIFTRLAATTNKKFRHVTKKPCGI